MLEQGTFEALGKNTFCVGGEFLALPIFPSACKDKKTLYLNFYL